MAAVNPPPRFKDPVGNFPLSIPQILCFLFGFYLPFFLELANILPPLDPAWIRQYLTILPRFSDFYIVHGWFYAYPISAGLGLCLIWTMLFEFSDWKKTIAP